MKGRLIALLKWIIAILLFIYLARSGKVDFQSLTLFFDHPFLLITILFLIILQILIACWRWLLILHGLEIKIGFVSLARIVWTGQFFNNLLFGSVGGDVIRIFYLSEATAVKKKTAAFSVFIDRVTGLYSLFLFCYFGLLLGPATYFKIPELEILFQAVQVVVLLSTAVLFLLYQPFFAKNIVKVNLLRGLCSPFLNPLFKRNLSFTLGLSLLTQLVISYSVYIISLPLQTIQEVSWADMLPLSSLGLLSTAVPISPAGIGVAQVSFAQLFIWAGIKPISLGANVISLYQIIAILVNFIGFYFYIKIRKSRVL